MRDTMAERMKLMKIVLTVLLPVACAFAQPNAAAPKRPPITGIAHVAFYAKSLPQSAEFYQRLLGLQQAADAEDANGQSFYLNSSQRIDVIPKRDSNTAGLLDHIAISRRRQPTFSHARL
jgi:catechol-2,3-dioxygenase